MVNAAYEPMIALAVQGQSGQSRDIEAVVNTGFNGFLTLPTDFVSEIGFPFVSIGRGILADGSEIAYDVYGTTVLWDGQALCVEADTANCTPLTSCCYWTGTT